MRTNGRDVVVAQIYAIPVSEFVRPPCSLASRLAALTSNCRRLTPLGVSQVWRAFRSLLIARGMSQRTGRAEVGAFGDTGQVS